MLERSGASEMSGMDGCSAVPDSESAERVAVGAILVSETVVCLLFVSEIWNQRECCRELLLSSHNDSSFI